MDFDKPKVYGDTFISDGLVNIVLGMLRMGWYSQGHKFGLIDGNRWAQPWAQSGFAALL